MRMQLLACESNKCKSSCSSHINKIWRMGDAHSLIKWDGKSHHADQTKTETLLILKTHSKMKYSSIFAT